MTDESNAVAVSTNNDDVSVNINVNDRYVVLLAFQYVLHRYKLQPGLHLIWFSNY